MSARSPSSSPPHSDDDPSAARKFAFQHSRPRLSDPLRSRPTVMLPAGAALASSVAPGGSAASYLFAVNPSFSDADASLDMGNGQALRESLQFAAYKFLTSALATPFAMSGTLSQVQYLPNDATRARLDASRKNKLSDEDDSEDEARRQVHSEGDELDEDELDSDDPEYYDPTRSSAAAASEKRRAKQRTAVRRAATDATGYIRSTSALAQPAYQLPAEDRSSWGTFTALVSSEHEGLLSLWKGQTTAFPHDLLQLFLQPSLEGFLNDRFGLYDDTIPLQHLDRVMPNIVTMIGSNLAVGMLLSPLEVVKTRMMVQTLCEKHRRYTTPVHALHSIYASEHHSSLHSLYFSTPLLVPNILHHTLSPLFHHCAPVFVERVLGISHSDAPLRYATAEFIWNTIAATILMPIDTVRKRLQIQTEGGVRPFATVVATPAPYHGLRDCLYRIVVEEGGRRTRRSKKGNTVVVVRRTEDMWWWERLGVQALYRGFVVQCAGNLAMSTLSVLNLNPSQRDW